jgi:hypothetical protein
MLFLMCIFEPLFIVFKFGALRTLSNTFFLFLFFFEQPYIELANSYSTGKIAELEVYVQTNGEKFESVSFLPYIIHSILCFG